MKKICALWFALILICICFCGCGKDKLAAGSYVQIGTYSEEPILWKVYHVEEDIAYLMSDKIITIKAFDASGNYDLGRARANSGANNWENSALRAWLNSEKEVTYKQAPSKGFVYGGLNSYDTEPGFLSAFSQAEKELLLCTEITVYLAEKDKESSVSGTEPLERTKDFTELATENAYKTIVFDRVSLPCAVELSELNSEDRIATLTQSAKEDCKGHGDQDVLAYWTKTPNGISEFAQCVINAKGELSDAEPRNSCIGVRPVIYLEASGKKLTGAGTEDQPFVLK